MRPVPLLVITLLAGVTATAVTTPATAQETAIAPHDTTAVHDVTLITGDTVHVGAVAGQTTVDVSPGPGREHIPFYTSSAGRSVRVIPADAVPLLRDERLDERLFDISTLIGFGYDNGRDLPLIIRYAQSSTARRTVTGARVTRDLPAVNAVAVEQEHSTALWTSVTAARKSGVPGIDEIWLDGLRKPSLDVSVPMIGAPAAWSAGLTGKGVKVGVIDTGVDTTHPDLTGQVTAAQDFTTDGDTRDHVGHGTHVASTIAGTGAASDGRYKGVAPGASIYSAKVCVAEGCSDSAIIAGMTWAAEQGVKVANISLGGPDTPATDPIEAAVHDLTTRYGVLFVVAAGNDGDAAATVDSPGSSPDALTVGAVDKTGAMASFSSRGPRVGDYGLKPDVTAPGVGIVAALSADSEFPPTGTNPRYTALNGTSMATPHVAGAAVILTQQHPDWAPARIKATLMAAANPSPDAGSYDQGAGLVDVARGIGQQVTAEPVSLALQRGTTRNTVTYANSGPTALTLTVAVHPREAAPAGAFTVSPSSVTIPAGGTAKVTVTADSAALAATAYTGQLVATGGTVRVETPFALDVERHALTLEAIGQDGRAPTADQNWVTLLVDLDRGTSQVFANEASTTVGLPVGHYVVQTYVETVVNDEYRVVSLVAPTVVMDRDRTLSVDARAAKQVRLSLPKKEATPLYQETGWTIRTREPEIWGSNDPYANLTNIPLSYIWTGQIGTGRTPGFNSYVSGMFGPPGEISNVAYVYRAYFYEQGTQMAGLAKDLKAKDFATVHASVGADVAGVQASRNAVARAPGNSAVYRNTEGHGTMPNYSYDVPATVTEYYTQDKQTEWQMASAQSGYTYYQSAWRSYRAGKAYTENWANPVIGPAFPEPDFAQQHATRYAGDVLNGPGPLFGDNAGHAGFRFTREGSAALTVYRNGVKVGEDDETPQAFDVPAATGTYKIVADFRSDPAFTLSTRVTGEWTFRSGHVPDGQLVKLPMTAIRYTPRVDVTGQAAAGPLLSIPVTLERQVGAAEAHTTKLGVDVSFDDGATWRPAPVLRAGEQGVALIARPRGRGYVSLRASAADSSGNTTTQKIIRAFRY